MGARIGLVIFDCDGVLVDSEMIACGVEARALTAAGYPITTAEVARRYAGVSDADMRRAIEEESGRTLPDDHGARCAAEVENVFRRELRAVQGIAAVVDAVKASGRQVCIAS
ncbi:MAG: HAD family hydrolase, partial [Microvirga sp.]